MKIIIFGVSSKSSVGYLLGQQLNAHDKLQIIYASRSGKLGYKCDITNPRFVQKLMSKEKSDVIINAAGVFSTPQKLGNFNDWSKVKQHILARSFGSLILADAAIKSSNVKKIIMLGGRATSSDAGFAAYSTSNGALYALTQFISQYTKLSVYYVDLPMITDSTMAKALLGSGPKLTAIKSTDVKMITAVIKKILSNKYRDGTRIIVNKESKL
ncbi:TPA: hypothetical protein DCR79_01025 [Patescibacteria group bacterium]|nr:hypothetical protein [Patescibacteria group bacterium]